MQKDNVLHVTNHDDFNKTLAKTLNGFRCSGLLCDVNLQVQGKSVQAHRVVLAARSSYFQAMFSGNFQESEKTIVDIDMSHSVDDIDHLEEVISALYEGSCKVTASNISSLYHLASFFMYEELKQCLVEKLLTMTYTELDNIIQAYLLALTYGISHLEEKCLTVIQTRFHDYFIYQDDMLQLTVEQMKYLFNRKVHKYCSLTKVIVFLLKWIKQNSDRREEYQSVSLGLIGSFMTQTPSEALAKICVFLNTKKGDLLSTEFLNSVQDLIKKCLVTDIDQYQLTINKVENVLHDKVVTGKANCLVLVAPGQEIISNVCKSECEYILNEKNGKRIHLFKNFSGDQPMKLAIYDTDLRNWFEIGEFVPKARFDNKSNWKAATVNDQIYFISASQKICYTLYLKTLMCQEISMQHVFDVFHGNVKSIVPLAVDGHLIILVSDCMNMDQPDKNQEYVTHQKYFQLEPDLSWTLKSEIQHNHTNTPTSLINVHNRKVIVIKANIVISLGKNLLEIKEGHIFDLETSNIRKFLGPCYLSSPVRLLMNGETLNIVDGEGWKRQYDWEIQEWTFPEKTDLSLVRWCRSVSGSAEYPCLSHVAANAGDAIWEIASHGAFTNYLLKIDFNKDGDLQTTMHTPPPYIHFTLCTAGTCTNQLLQSLKDSEFMELGYHHT